MATPALPDALNDRATDNWEPLLAIAELAGADWADKARAAAKALSGDEATGDEEEGVPLLFDIRAAFDDCKLDAIFTKTLIDILIADEERPWASFERTGKAITGRQIARLLKPFGIISGTVRVGSETAKGYYRAAFEEAFHAYLPNSQTSQRHNLNGTCTSGVFSCVTEPECDGHESCDFPNNDEHCDAVTDRNAEIRQAGPKPQ